MTECMDLYHTVEIDEILLLDSKVDNQQILPDSGRQLSNAYAANK